MEESLTASGRKVSPLTAGPLTPTRPGRMISSVFRGGENAEGTPAEVPSAEGEGKPTSGASSPLSGLGFPLSALVGFSGIPREAAEEGPELYPSLMPLLPPTSMTRLRRSSAHSGASNSPFRLTTNCFPDDLDGANASLRTPISPGASENFDLQQHHRHQEEGEGALSSLKGDGSSLPQHRLSYRDSSPLLRSAGPIEFDERKLSPGDVGVAASGQQRLAAAWQQHLRASFSDASSADTSGSDALLREETRRNTERNASPLSSRKLYTELQLQHRRPTVRKSSSPLVRRQASRAFAAVASAPVTPVRRHAEDPQPERTPPTPTMEASARTPAAVATATPPAGTPVVGGAVGQAGSPMRSILRAPSAAGSARNASLRRVNFTPQQEEQNGEAPDGEGAAASPIPAATEAAVAARVSEDSSRPEAADPVPSPPSEQHQWVPPSALGSPETSPPYSGWPSDDVKRQSPTSDASEHQGGDAELQPQRPQPCEKPCVENPTVETDSDVIKQPFHTAKTSPAAETIPTADTAPALTEETGAVTEAEASIISCSAAETSQSDAPGASAASVPDIAIGASEHPGAVAVFPNSAAPSSQIVVGVTEQPTAAVDEAPAAGLPPQTTEGRQFAAETAETAAGGSGEETENAGLGIGEMSAAPPTPSPEAAAQETRETPAADGASAEVAVTTEASESPGTEAGDSACSRSLSARVLVMNGDGETEMLLQETSCLVAPALNEPLQADPTPLRKPPSRPPSRAEAHAAAKVRWGAHRDAAAVAEPSSAVAPTDAGTPDILRDEEMEGHREAAAATRHPSMQKQQQHGVQGPDSLGSPADGSEETPGVAPTGDTFDQLLTPVTEATAVAAAPLAARPTADGANADRVESNKSPNTQLTHLFEEAVTQQQIEDPQQQQQQPEGNQGGPPSPSAESSEMGSSPVTPFAGPDPLSGDAPLSPRLTDSSGRGALHGVSTSAVSFLLSVRQQLEAQAARLQDEEQQGLPQQQHEEGEKTQELQQQKGAPERCDTKEEGLQEQQGAELEQQQDEQQQQHEDPLTPARSEASQGQQQEEQQNEGASPAAAVSTEDAAAGRSDAPPPIPRNSSSSNNGGGSPSSPAVAPAPGEEGLLSKPVTRREDAGRRTSGNSSLTCSSETSPGDEAAVDSEAKATSSVSSSIPQHPQWRMQWRALDALTSKLLQGLPRALTAIADGDESPIAAAATTAREGTAAETPTALEPTQIVGNREEEPPATPAAAETPPASPCISWVEYREERLRDGHLVEPNKRKENPTQEDQDVEAHTIHDASGEEAEVHQLLQQRLQQRALAPATAAAGQLLLHPAKSRAEWAEVCAKTQQVLQEQLQQELEPLVSETTRALQQLEEALERAASRVEGAAEAKRRRLVKEPWERGFITLAEERHIALQGAASEVDDGAAALGRLLEEEMQLTEEIEAADAEIRRFADTSGDLRLLADIRHKESVVGAFERLSGMRIQRVSATGLVAELAWPRSFPAAAALRSPAAPPTTESGQVGGLLQRLPAAAEAPVPPTRITISWSTEKSQQLPQHQQPQGASLLEDDLRRLHSKPPAAPPMAPTPPAAACAEPVTPLRQRVQILRPFLPAGGRTCDSAVCTPLLARARGGALAAGAATTAGAPAATSAPTGPALQQHQQHRVQEGASGSRFLPITSCKLQSRFPVLRAAAAAATKSGSTQAEALPPHRRWLYSVEMLRYLLLGAVQRSLQQMLQRQGGAQGATPTSPPAVAAEGPSNLRWAVAAASGTEGIRRSTESDSFSSVYSGSSNTPAADCEQRAMRAPPFPDLSTVRALLLHAHAAAGRVALLHDQLLLLLRSFRTITSVDFEEKADTASLPNLVFKTVLAPCNDELPVLQLRLEIDLNEALSRGSLLLAVAGLRVRCLSAADDSCSDGQAAYSALERAIESRLEAMWDAEKQQLSSEKFSRVFSDEGLVECLYTACDECGYTRTVEDWRLCLHEETPALEENASSPNVPWGAAEAAALGRWVTLLQETGFVPPLPQQAASAATDGV